MGCSPAHPSLTPAMTPELSVTSGMAKEHACVSHSGFDKAFENQGAVRAVPVGAPT